MGSTMKPTIFNERVALALKTWHHIAKKHVKHNHGSLLSSSPIRPTTPTHSSSRSGLDNFEAHQQTHRYDTDSSSPSNSHHHRVEVDAAPSGSLHHHEEEMGHLAHDQQDDVNERNSISLGPGPTQHEIDIEQSKEFSFDKTTTN